MPPTLFGNVFPEFSLQPLVHPINPISLFAIITYLGKDKEKQALMNLTERERVILQFSRQGLSDYRIARKINTDPPSVTRSRKNAHRKLLDAATDLEWAAKMGVNLSASDLCGNGSTGLYSFFL